MVGCKVSCQRRLTLQAPDLSDVVPLCTYLVWAVFRIVFLWGNGLASIQQWNSCAWWWSNLVDVHSDELRPNCARKSIVGGTIQCVFIGNNPNNVSGPMYKIELPTWLVTIPRSKISSTYAFWWSDGQKKAMALNKMCYSFLNDQVAREWFNGGPRSTAEKFQTYGSTKKKRFVITDVIPDFCAKVAVSIILASLPASLKLMQDLVVARADTDEFKAMLEKQRSRKKSNG